MLLAGLDLLDEGVSLFDENLTLLAWNRLFIDLLGFPEEMVKVGTPFEDFIRYNAQHGEYGEVCRDLATAIRPATIDAISPSPYSPMAASLPSMPTLPASTAKNAPCANSM